MTTETKSTWQQEREREQAQCAQLRKVVAAIRLDGWSYKPSTTHDYGLGSLVNPALRGELWFAGPGWHQQNKIHISACYPKDSRGHDHIGYKETRVSINVSAEKTAEQIAKDITRRILPEYLRQLAAINESIAKTENYLNARSEMGKAIASAFPWLRLHDTIHGTDYNGRKQNGSEVTLDEKYDTKAPRVDKVKCSEERVDIALDGLTQAQAMEVLTLIARMKGGA